MSSFKRKNLAGGLVELNRSKEPDHDEWVPMDFGKLVFQKDYGKLSYFFRLFNLESNTKSNEFIWEYEMYTPFVYYELEKTFQYFPAEGYYIGFNFSNIEHAESFYEVVNHVAKAREELYMTKNKKSKKIDSNTNISYKNKTITFTVKNHLADKKIFGNFFRSKKVKDSKIDTDKSNVSLTRETSNLSKTNVLKNFDQSSDKSIVLQETKVEPTIPPLPPPRPPKNVLQSSHSSSTVIKNDTEAQSVSHPHLVPPLPKTFIRTDSHRTAHPLPKIQPEVPAVLQSESLPSSLLNEIESFNLKKLKKATTVDKTVLHSAAKSDVKSDKNLKLTKVNQKNLSTQVVDVKKSKSKVNSQEISNSITNKGNSVSKKTPNQKLVESTGLQAKTDQVLGAKPQPPPPPPPPPMVISKPEPIKINKAKENAESKNLNQVVDLNQALMESIRSFKGFKKKEQTLMQTKKPLPKLELKDQLRDVLASRKAFLNQSSEESASDVEW